MSRPSLFRIFKEFLVLGATAFGGPAMVAYIRKLAVEKHRWIDIPEFESGLSFCQVIPGATAMQVAGYVGLRTRGFPGAAIAYAGFAFPATVLVIVLSSLYLSLHTLPPVVSILHGLRPVVVGVILYAVLSLGRPVIRGVREVGIAIAAATLLFIGIHPVLAILLAAMLGCLLLSPSPERETTRLSYLSSIPSTTLISALAIVFIGAGMVAWLQPLLFRLFISMIQVDLFAFGGGFAAYPLMYHEVVRVQGWMDEKTFLDGIALGQVTPGPIVITATFVGFVVAGLAGAIIATIGIFIGSFFLLVGLYPLFNRIQGSTLMKRASHGILLSFIGLLVSVCVTVALAISWDPVTVFLAFGSFAALLLGIEILWVILAGVLLSLLLL